MLAAGAIRAYIGLRAAAVDMGLGTVNWLSIDKTKKKNAPAPSSTEQDVDWSTILYYGARRLLRDLRVRSDRRRRIQHSKR